MEKLKISRNKLIFVKKTSESRAQPCRWQNHRFLPSAHGMTADGLLFRARRTHSISTGPRSGHGSGSARTTARKWNLKNGKK